MNNMATKLDRTFVTENLKHLSHAMEGMNALANEVERLEAMLVKIESVHGYMISLIPDAAKNEYLNDALKQLDKAIKGELPLT